MQSLRRGLAPALAVERRETAKVIEPPALGDGGNRDAVAGHGVGERLGASNHGFSVADDFALDEPCQFPHSDIHVCAPSSLAVQCMGVRPCPFDDNNEYVGYRQSDL